MSNSEPKGIHVVLGGSPPPKGLSPGDATYRQRMLEIQRACNRMMAEQRPVPVEWIQEYNKLVVLLKVSDK